MQLGWQLEFIIATPLLLRYGASASVVSQIWTAGPVALILITGPLTRWSDHYFATGRHGRVPFVGVLNALIFLSLGLVPLCAIIKGEDNTPKLAVLFVLFSVLNGGCNLSSGFQRTCAADLATTSTEGVLGQSFVQSAYTLGGVLAGVIGLIEWGPLLEGTGLEEYQMICILGVSVMLPCYILQLIAIWPSQKRLSEERLLAAATNFITHQIKRPPSPTSTSTSSSPPTPLPSSPISSSSPSISSSSSSSSLGKPVGLWQTLKQMPPVYIHMVLQQLMAWTGLYPCWIFLTAYFACDVYGGDPDATKGSLKATLFDEGQSWGSGAIMWLGVSCFLFTFVNPYLIRVMGYTNSYVACQTFAALAMGAMFFVTDKWYSLVLFLIGIAPAWSANGCVPWVLCDEVLTPVNRGFGMTQLFTLSSLSQPLCGLIVTPFITRSSFRASFLVGGVMTLCSALYAMWLYRGVERRFKEGLISPEL